MKGYHSLTYPLQRGELKETTKKKDFDQFRIIKTWIRLKTDIFFNTSKESP